MKTTIAVLLLSGVACAQLPDQAVWFTRPDVQRTPANADLGGRMADAIGAAKKSVAFAMLRLDLPVVLDALIAANQRDVDVRVLTDDDIRALRFAQPYEKLARAGVAVRTDRAFPWSATLHHKFCVIDGTHVWGGDWNASLGDSTRGHHAAFLVKSTGLAARFTKHFDRMWRGEAAGPGSISRSPGAPSRVAGGGTARAHFGSAQDLGGVVADEILGAKRSVDVAHTFFNHRRVLMALLEVARRGVRVRVGASFFEGRTRSVDALARFGVLISRKAGTKTIVIDGSRVVTGSWNATDGVDHENVVVFDGCPGLSAAFETGIDRILTAGTKPYFVAVGDASNRPSDRERDARVTMLRRRKASGIPKPADLDRLDARRRLTAAFDRGTPVVPTVMNWRSSEALSRHRRVAVTFERSGRAPVLTRYVLSVSALNDSFGPHVDPRHRPVLFDPAAIGRLDQGLTLEWDATLPEAGTWRAELDAFTWAGSGWRWSGNWRLEPAAWSCAPEVTLDGADAGATIVKLRVQGEPRIVMAGLDVDPKEATAIEIEATSRGGEAVHLSWSVDGRSWSAHDVYDLPLIADGARHRYLVDLSSNGRWSSATRIRAIRVHRGEGTRSAELHGWRLVEGRRLGHEALGTFRDAAGRPRLHLSVDGNAAGGTTWVRARRPIKISVTSPAPDGKPVPFLLLVKRGWPRSDEAFDLTPFRVPGRLCFRPHLVTPQGEGVMGVADSTGLDPAAFARPGPAPATFDVPLGVVESGDTLVVQAVFIGEETKGVSNAVVLRVR